MNADWILEQANGVVTEYTQRRVADAARHQAACGCRSCIATGNGWLAWLAGDNVALYERLRLRFKWENQATTSGEAAA